MTLQSHATSASRQHAHMASRRREARWLLHAAKPILEPRADKIFFRTMGTCSFFANKLFDMLGSFGKLTKI